MAAHGLDAPLSTVVVERAFGVADGPTLVELALLRVEPRHFREHLGSLLAEVGYVKSAPVAVAVASSPLTDTLRWAVGLGGTGAFEHRPSLLGPKPSFELLVAPCEPLIEAADVLRQLYRCFDGHLEEFCATVQSTLMLHEGTSQRSVFMALVEAVLTVVLVHRDDRLLGLPVWIDLSDA